MIKTYTFEEYEQLSKKEHLPKEVLECVNKHFRSRNGKVLWESGMKNGLILTFENVVWDFGENTIIIESLESD